MKYLLSVRCRAGCWPAATGLSLILSLTLFCQTCLLRSVHDGRRVSRLRSQTRRLFNKLKRTGDCGVSWGLCCSGMWCWVIGWLEPDILRQHGGVIFKGQNVREETWRSLHGHFDFRIQDHYTIPEQWAPIAQWLATISQKKRDLNCTTLKA